LVKNVFYAYYAIGRKVFFTRVGTYIQRGSKFCFVVLVVVVVLADTLIRLLHFRPISPCFQHIAPLHAALPCSGAALPCSGAALPGSLAWQPCPAAFSGSLVRQPDPAALPGNHSEKLQAFLTALGRHAALPFLALCTN
jgi:hypothetical protein